MRPAAQGQVTDANRRENTDVGHVAHTVATENRSEQKPYRVREPNVKYREYISHLGRMGILM